MILVNAFSANMLGEGDHTVAFKSLSLEEAQRLSNGATSAVGHAETAAIFAAVLGVAVAADRRTVTLVAGAQALLGQYTGPRLPEGATALPPGASIRWMLVTVA